MKITIRKIGDVAVPATEADREKWEKYSDAEYVVDMRNLDQRTAQQNKALHRYFELLAEALNEAGYTMQFVMSHRRIKIIVKVMDWLARVCADCKEKIDEAKEMMTDPIDGEAPWTKEMVKENLWRTYQREMLKKESTTALKRNEIDVVYDGLNRFLGERYGISVSFPSRELWSSES